MAGEGGALKALKIIVYGMSGLLVLGIITLVYGLVTKGASTASKMAAPAVSVATAPASAVTFAPLAVPLGNDARVEQVLSSGNLIVVQVGGSGGKRLIVLDPAQGRVTGEFTLGVSAP